MPRDKTLSHERVMSAAKEEFLEHGFEKASMRAIGEKAGMTPAGLYRHAKSKEDLFDMLVEPVIDDMEKWYERHMNAQYAMIDADADKNELFGSSEIDFVREVVYSHIDEFRLILLCAQGTKYQNFIHDMVIRQQDDFMKALDYMRSKGMKVKRISKKELHMLLSAYTTALLEPIVHNMSEEEMEHCLSTITDFFVPGWQRIMGF